MADACAPRGRILMFSSPGCPHCVRAKDLLLTAKRVSFHVIDLQDFPEMREEMVQRSGGRKTVPQIFFGAKYIGGADNLFELSDQGALDDLLEVLALQEPHEFPTGAIEITPEATPIMDTIAAEIRLIDDLKHILSDKPLDGNRSEMEVRELVDRALFMIVEGMKGRRGKVKGLTLKSHRVKMSYVKHSMRGSAIRTYFYETLGLTGAASTRLGQALLKEGYIVRVGKADIMRFSSDASALFRFADVKNKNVFNMSKQYTLPARHASQVAAELGRMIMMLRDKFISMDGRSVDYTALKNSFLFLEYARKTLELQKLDLAPLNRSEKMCFFINIYNALVIHANVILGPPKTIFQRAHFFGSVGYTIGGLKYTLSEIEHGVLRANRKPPGLFPKQPFSATNPRRPLALLDEEFDPRIHFALVCGAKSCPPIRVFLPENLENALQWATEGFCQEEVTINAEKRKVKMSMLFKWYHIDFGKTDKDMLNWVLQYLPKDTLLQNDFKVSYHAYSWDQNGRGYDQDQGATVSESPSTGSEITFEQTSHDVAGNSSDILTTITDDDTHTDIEYGESEKHQSQWRTPTRDQERKEKERDGDLSPCTSDSPRGRGVARIKAGDSRKGKESGSPSNRRSPRRQSPRHSPRRVKGEQERGNEGEVSTKEGSASSSKQSKGPRRMSSQLSERNCSKTKESGEGEERECKNDATAEEEK